MFRYRDLRVRPQIWATVALSSGALMPFHSHSHALASGCGLCRSLYRHPTTTFKAVRGPIHAEPAQILAHSAAP